MQIWQADFYRRPLQTEDSQPLWELLICNIRRQLEYVAYCPQSEVNAQWLIQQLQQATQTEKPDVILVFRPQCLSLLQTAAAALDISVQPSRRTPVIKQWLQERSQLYPQLAGYTAEAYNPVKVDGPPPVPLPENLWGEVWQFATLEAGVLINAFAQYPIPVLDIPEALQPLNLGLASAVPISGVVINGGRQSMQLARWLQNAAPVALSYIPGDPDGLILEAGLADRFVVATFNDAEVSAAAQRFETRKQLAKGLHFLLIQPDDSGMTYTGFWLLQSVPS
ncbi:MAG: Tab2/Atab2 family RNA-binding protein [Microcoleaceae cyanobacterium]